MTTDPARLAAELDAVNETGLSAAPPNFNVAPTTDIATVVARHDQPGDPDDQAIRRVRLMRWGLLPSWVKADADGRPISKALLINARADKLTSSPAFRSAAAHKRCLIPMDGYYEWMPAENPKGRKTPFYLHRADGRPLFVAGLWSAWRAGASSESTLTCAIITTDAVDQLGRIHDRMPLPIAEADWDRWLDPDRAAPADLLAARPDVSGIEIREVSTLVNSVRNNGPELIAPAGSGNQPVGLF